MSLFTKLVPPLRSVAGRGRKFSTSPGGEGGGAGVLVAGVATTFATYMTADFLSNFIQHPTQKVYLYNKDPV